jgi:hypothetical protein
MKHTIKEKCRITNQENIFNTDFKPHELTKATASLKTRKSPGPNHIMTEFLKHLGPVAFDTLLQLFNQIWKISIPAMWRKAIIIPLLKAKKPASELSSYQPISLMSTLAKTGKNGWCKIELVSGNPKSPVTSSSRLQEILLNKSTNCYA